MEILIKAYLEEHINRWYRIAEADYGIKGKFIDVKFEKKQNGKDVTVYFKEDGRIYKTTIFMDDEVDGIDYVYNVWMEDAEFEIVK